ncbi:MAG: hypothetical protein JNG84_08220, partial [Archangium sp.]|nr:hypothetical protein [Archangium sp.]
LNIPFSFANNATIGLGVEPGIVASYELTERAEIFTGALVSYNQQIWSRTASQSATYAGFTGTLRGGFAYAIMSKAGIFVNVDLYAGYEPVRRKIVIGDQNTGLALGAAITAGFQMSL